MSTNEPKLVIVRTFDAPLVAYWQFHAPGSFWTSVNGGVPAVLYCFLFLYYSMVGAGKWSIDDWWVKRKSAAA